LTISWWTDWCLDDFEHRCMCLSRGNAATAMNIWSVICGLWLTEKAVRVLI
jgi:hypothetical protein